MSIKNSNDTIGNRNLDFRACSAARFWEEVNAVIRVQGLMLLMLLIICCSYILEPRA